MIGLGKSWPDAACKLVATKKLNTRNTPTHQKKSSRTVPPLIVLRAQPTQWCFGNTVPRRTSGRRGFRPTWPSHAWHWIACVGAARQRLDTDSTWIPGRGPATARRRERARTLVPTVASASRPSIKEGTRLSRAQGASARSSSNQSARHVVGAQAPQAPERAAQRYNSGLTAL